MKILIAPLLFSTLLAWAEAPGTAVAPAPDAAPAAKAPVAPANPTPPSAPATPKTEPKTSSSQGDLPRLLADPESVQHGLVVSVDPVASRIGADVLRRGGNAVDAAVATGFALAVTYPRAGNIGGGGYMMVRLAKTGETFAVDYREVAPKLAKPDMFLDAKGNIDPQKSTVGFLVVGVPGTPMGFWTAHQKAGKLPWRELVAPAVELAEVGIEVDETLSKSLAGQVKVFTEMKEPAKVYLVDGKAPKPGTLLKLPELAKSLRRIMENGPDGFYKGETADLLVAAMEKNGGFIRHDDLAGYKAVIRKPLEGKYRDYEILTIPPSSGGGTILLETLGILEGFDLHALGHNKPRTLHLMAESMKRSFVDRARYLGDPDFQELPIDKILSKENLEQWRKGIGKTATPSAKVGADLMANAKKESPQTTHYSIIDAEGNMVSNTYTLEMNYGAKVIAPGTGFLLNNEMGDFNLKPGLTDTNGRVGTEPNRIAPGKRMLSSQCPTLVLRDGKPYLVIGSPGGRTIPNTVLQVLSNVIDHRMPLQGAVDAGRIHHQWQPDVIRMEGRLPEETAQKLKEMGHAVDRGGVQGDCQAILIDPVTGRYIPGIDRRVKGGAVGY